MSAAACVSPKFGCPKANSAGRVARFVLTRDYTQATDAMDLIPSTNGHTDLANGEASSSSTAPSAATSFDPELFRNYLLALLPPVIGASPEDLESLFDDEFDARVIRFASEAGAVLYVVKSKEEQEGA